MGSHAIAAPDFTNEHTTVMGKSGLPTLLEDLRFTYDGGAGGLAGSKLRFRITSPELVTAAVA